jgi:TetR/AcrR family transcriptional regulator, transcriptional repressor for nem operon
MSNTILPYHLVDKQVPMRKKLVLAATKYFTLQGYHGTSLADIAQACDIRKASIFYHFESKQAMALCAIECLQQYCDREIFQPIVYQPDVPIAQRVQHFAAAIEQFYAQQPDGTLPGGLATELTGVKTAFDQPIRNYFQAWIHATETLLGHFCEQMTAEQSARELIAQMQGSMTLGRVYQDPSFVQQTCASFLMRCR